MKTRLDPHTLHNSCSCRIIRSGGSFHILVLYYLRFEDRSPTRATEGETEGDRIPFKIVVVAALIPYWFAANRGLALLTRHH